MLDIKTSLALIQHNFPQIEVQTALPITRGWDSFVLEVNELHSFPITRAMQTGVQGHTPAEWRERYQERYIDLQVRVFPLLDKESRAKSEQLWEDFLNNETIFAFRPVLIHCDLACEHIFCDPVRGVLTGVIDWGDATIGDPALDFVGLHHGRGSELTEHVLACYKGTVDAAFWKRMNFYLCYRPFSELLYGVYSNSEKFIAKGIEGLHSMFRA